MSIPIACPSCRAEFDVPERLAGKLIRCKACREEFRVGQTVAGADDYDEPRRPAASSGSNTAVIVVVVVLAGVGLLALAGVAVWLMMRPAVVPMAGRPGAMPNAGVPFPVAPDGPIVPAAPAPPTVNGIMPEHTFHPARSGRRMGLPAEIPAGPEVVTLSNFRRAESRLPDRPAYQVDYTLTGGPMTDREWYYLVAKVPAGVSEIHLFRLAANQGTLSFWFFPGHDPGGKFELWVEREPFGKRQERKRVSPVVKLD
jgi:hypothetical protein